MPWSTPRTWLVEELVTAANMNTYISDNLTYLMDGPSGDVNTSTTYCATSATSYSAIDANLNATITVARPRVLVYWWFNSMKSNSGGLALTVSNGSADLGAIASIPAGATWASVGLMGLFTGLTVGTSYTFTPQWKVVTTGNGNTTSGATYQLFGAMEI